MKQTVCIVVVLVAFALALALGLGLGLGLRKPKPRDDSDVPNAPGGPPQQKGSGNNAGVGERTTQGEDGKGKKGNELDVVTKTERWTTSTTTTKPLPTAAHASYRNVTVQSDRAECSKIGTDVLVIHHGSAVDAAIATMLCIGVIQMQSTNIGGGHFMTIYDAPSRTVNTRLSREVLPMAADINYYKNHSSFMGGTAIGVPGELKGLYSAWQLHGKTPWAQLVEPSIKLADDGFVISGAQVYALKNEEERIMDDDILREMLTKNGKLLEKGETLRRKKYADTLRRVANDPESFYSGSLADDVVADIQERGGIVTKEDLQKYQTQDVPPIVGRLKNLNLTMYSPPPPSSGVIVQLILKILDGYGMTPESIADTDSSILTYQRLLEAWKHSYAKRSSLGDARFVDIENIMRNITSDSYIDGLRLKVDEMKTRHTDYYEPQFEQKEDHGTSHINVLARDGSAVAMTSTINTYFGSLVVGSRTGIVFNNEMDDFSVPGTTNAWGFSPSPSNYAEPGKMPMSSMSPTIILNDDYKVAYLTGGEGGSSILSGNTFVALHALYLGLDIKDALSHPRFHHQLLPDEVPYEVGWDPVIIDGLIAKGHKFIGPKESLANPVGVVHNRCATCKDYCPKPCIEAVSDWRKEGGAPHGYRK